MKKGKKRLIGLVSVLLAVLLIIGGGEVAMSGSFLRVLRDTALVGIDYIAFSHPLKKIGKSDMADNITKANSSLSHPFVLVTADEFASVKNEYTSPDGDAYIKDRMSYAVKKADEMLSLPLLERVIDDDGELLPVSREAVDRVMTLAGVWQITGDDKYAVRCRDEIINVCNFSDWHHEHFLDVTEMSFAVSLGYDWLYDFLTEDEKDFIAERVFEFGIEKGSVKKIFSNWWLWSKVNWNTQCYGGMGVACMVFSDRYPKEASALLSAAYYNMPLHFASFSPDGAYVEGNSYWEAMSSYLTYFVSTSRNFFGTDFGLSTVSGFDKIGYFPLYISAPDCVFNFGDNRNYALFAPSLNWFANEYNEPMLSYFQKLSVKENELTRESVLSCLWYSKDLDFSDTALSRVPLSVYMRSDASEEFVTFRSAYCDKNATYLGIKGGYNYSNHGDLDIGSFVFDALGERWFCDLGKVSYSLPGYFTGTVGGGRWKAYAKRAEGHNTLVINPGRVTEDQYPFARAEFSSFTEADGGGRAVLDMTDAYCRNGVKSAVRTVEMYDGYRNVKISDSVSCKKASEIYWFAHTDAEIELSDGGKAAKLTKVSQNEDGTENIKCVLVKLSAPAEGVFTVVPAAPLATEDRYPDSGETENLKKLSVHLSGITDAEITVTIEPQY